MPREYYRAENWDELNWVLTDLSHRLGQIRPDGSIVYNVIGGWAVSDTKIYNIEYGSTMNPQDGIIFDSQDNAIYIYESFYKRLAIGNLAPDLSTRNYGIKAWDSSGTTGSVLFELSDSQNMIAGWTISSGSLAYSTNIVLDSTNNAIYLAESTFGKKGIQIEYNAGSPRIYVGDGANAFFQHDGTNLTWKAAKTELDSSGKLTATDVELTGQITAASGAIGGWTINADSLSNSSVTIHSTGALYFKDTTFGAEGVQIEYNAGDPRIYVGDGVNEFMKFDGTNFTFKGALSELDSSGKITLTGGAIGGWLIGTSTLQSSDNTVILNANANRLDIGNLVIDGTNQKIQSTDYSSGVTGAGFLICSSLIEAGNAYIRGVLRTAVFQKDVISAVGGDVMVIDADTLAVDMTSTGDTYVMVTKGLTTFSSGDILRIKDGTDDEWLECTGGITGTSYTVTRDKAGSYATGTNPTWKAGATIVNYGPSGQGGILLSGSTDPYIRFFTHAGAPWTTLSTGILIKGTGSIGIMDSTYGNQGIQLEYNNGTPRMYAGDGVNQYFQFDGTNVMVGGGISATSGTIAGWSIGANSLSNSSVTLHSTGALYIKDTTFSAAGIQLEYNAGTPRLYCGDGASQYLQFDGTNVMIGGGLSATSGTIAGWSIGTAALSNSSCSLQSTGALYIKSSTFGDLGIQLEYNDAAPQVYIGDGSSDYFKYTSGGGVEISVDSTAGLTVRGGGGIRLETGGDILLTAGSGDAALLGFEPATGTNYYFGADSSRNALRLWGESSGTFTIGYDTAFTYKPMKTINMDAAGQIQLLCASGTTCSFLQQAGTSTGHITLSVSEGASTAQVKVHMESSGPTVEITSKLVPAVDSAYTLGHSTYCWSNVYADAGVTGCSDRKYKTAIKVESLGLNFINKLVPIEWEWNKATGKTLEGKYRGVIAQDVEAVLDEVGYKDDFGGVQKSAKGSSTNYGFMYNQLIGPLIKAVQELSTKVTDLEAELASLSP